MRRLALVAAALVLPVLPVVVAGPAFAVPDTTIIGGPTGPTADSSPTFSFSSDSGATFECQVDAAAYAACSGPGATHTTAVLADGPHTFSVRAVDSASAVDASPATRGFTVDTTSPDSTITTKPAKRVTKRKSTFAFFSGDATASFKCQLDGGAFRPCSSPTKVKVALGKHTFAVRATDPVGNIDYSPATYKFKRVAKQKH